MRQSKCKPITCNSYWSCNFGKPHLSLCSLYEIRCSHSHDNKLYALLGCDVVLSCTSCLVLSKYCWISHLCVNVGRMWKTYSSNFLMIRDSSVGIATGYLLDCWGSIPGRRKIFLFYTAVRPALGPTRPPTQWEPGPGCEHSHPSRADVKNGGAIPPLPIRLDNFTSLPFINSNGDSVGRVTNRRCRLWDY
jgi:hypothetical protein